MTPARTLVSFVDRFRWPTAIRADLLVRAYALDGAKVTHWVVSAQDQPIGEQLADLGVACAGAYTADEFADCAQVMVDRLLSKGLAYSAGRRIFLPWGGAPSYNPIQNLRGRRGPFDVQLWGPHWDDGPEGPSATLLRWATILELAGGPVDWVFGFEAATMRRARALAQALGVAEIATAYEPPMQMGYPLRDPFEWDGQSVRWAALQIKQELRSAQEQHCVAQTRVIRALPRSMPDRPLSAPRAMLLRDAHEHLIARRWRRAATVLQQIAKSGARMRDGRDESRVFLMQALALFDGLGL